MKLISKTNVYEAENGRKCTTNMTLMCYKTSKYNGAITGNPYEDVEYIFEDDLDNVAVTYGNVDYTNAETGNYVKWER